jgi:hypothetical protein
MPNYPSSFVNGTYPGVRVVNNVTDKRDLKYYNQITVASQGATALYAGYASTSVIGTGSGTSARYVATATAFAAAGALSLGGLSAAASIGATLQIDGIGITVLGTQVLIRTGAPAGGTGASFINGLWSLTTVGASGTSWVLTRSTQLDSFGDAVYGSQVFVSSGSTVAGGVASNNKSYYFGTTGAVTVGTDNIQFISAPTAAQYNSAAKYPTDVTVGTGNTVNSTMFIEDFKMQMSVMQNLLADTATSMASLTGIGASFVSAAHIISIRNLRSKFDKNMFELNRLKSDIDRINTVGFSATFPGMGLTSRYPSGRNRGWGPN